MFAYGGSITATVFKRGRIQFDEDLLRNSERDCEVGAQKKLSRQERQGQLFTAALLGEALLRNEFLAAPQETPTCKSEV